MIYVLFFLLQSYVGFEGKYALDDGDGFVQKDDDVNSCNPEEGFVSKEGDCQDNGIPLCSLIAGYVNNDLDCDDSDALISPETIEICDGVDSDYDDRENILCKA